MDIIIPNSLSLNKQNKRKKLKSLALLLSSTLHCPLSSTPKRPASTSLALSFLSPSCSWGRSGRSACLCARQQASKIRSSPSKRSHSLLLFLFKLRPHFWVHIINELWNQHQSK